MGLGGVVQRTRTSTARLGDVCIHNHVLLLYGIPAFVLTGFG